MIAPAEVGGRGVLARHALIHPLIKVRDRVIDAIAPFSEFRATATAGKRLKSVLGQADAKFGLDIYCRMFAVEVLRRLCVVACCHDRPTFQNWAIVVIVPKIGRATRAGGGIDGQNRCNSATLRA
jgi:hypothetical protein